MVFSINPFTAIYHARHCISHWSDGIVQDTVLSLRGIRVEGCREMDRQLKSNKCFIFVCSRDA